MATWYVDTGAAGAANGTNYANAYTSLAAAVAAKQASLSDDIEFMCRASTGQPDTAAVVVSGYTVNGHTIRITGDPGEASGKHAGIYSTNKYLLKITNADKILEIGTGQTTAITGIQIEATAPEQASASVYCGASDVTIGDCLLVGHGNNTYAHRGIIGMEGASNTYRVYNTVIYGLTAASGSRAIEITAGTAYLYNVTAINAASSSPYGIRRTGGTVYAYNCYSGGNQGDCWDGTITMAYCASSDATADDNGGDGNLINIAIDTTSGDGHAGFVSVTPGEADYLKLKSDSWLVGRGTDNPGSGLYSTDIAGRSRTSTWDIGAFEYAATARPAYYYAQL